MNKINKFFEMTCDTAFYCYGIDKNKSDTKFFSLLHSDPWLYTTIPKGTKGLMIAHKMGPEEVYFEHNMLKKIIKAYNVTQITNRVFNIETSIDIYLAVIFWNNEKILSLFTDFDLRRGIELL